MNKGGNLKALAKARKVRAAKAKQRALDEAELSVEFRAWSREEAQLWAAYVKDGTAESKRAWLAHWHNQPKIKER